MNRLKRITVFFIITVLFSVSGCGVKKEKAPGETENRNYKYESKSFSRNFEGCPEQLSECASVSIRYIDFTEGHFRDKLNEFLESYISDSLYHPEEGENGNYYVLTENFFDEYSDVLKDYPEYSRSHYFNVNVSVNYENNEVITAGIEYEIYSGGAHPNHGTYYFVFSKTSGKRLYTSDLFSPGFEYRLNKIIDSTFRSSRDISPQESLSDKAELFEDEIKFNNNYAVREDTLEFHYNPYEIAPYSAGDIKVIIPMKNLIDIKLKTKSVK